MMRQKGEQTCVMRKGSDVKVDEPMPKGLRYTFLLSMVAAQQWRLLLG